MNMFVTQYPYYTYNTYLGSMAQEHRMNIISNNLANINTPGFKRDVPVFEGYIVKSTAIHFSQGTFRETGNRLDLALSGPGFFQVDTPNGVRYTRNGNFTLNEQGQVVDMQGAPLVGGGVVPPETVDLHITTDGRVMADGAQVGQVELVEFEDLRILAKEGNSYFAPKIEGVAGNPAEETTVEQGYLEMANVDAVEQSVNLIDTVRTYEVFQKIIFSFEEADQKSINEVGRLA